MSLAPILNAPIVVQLHVVVALCAVFVGPLVLLRRSRDVWHKSFGYVWAIAMAMTALTSFGIPAAIGPGPASPIHLLSVFTLWGLWQGIRAARLRKIAEHRKEMRSLYFWAIGIAGMLTFLPGRRMNTAIFGDASMSGFLLMAGLIGTCLIWFVYANRENQIQK